MQPRMSVSYVARRAGVAPSLLFNWRRRRLEGGLQAVQADEDDRRSTQAIIRSRPISPEMPAERLINRQRKANGKSQRQVCAGSCRRPSIDPELIRMLIVGYCFGIRSERRLCEEVDLNLAYRWFARSARRRRPGSFHLFEEPAWPFPRGIATLVAAPPFGLQRLHSRNFVV